VPENLTLCCNIKGPIKNWPKFKNSFFKEIETLLKTGKIGDQYQNYQIVSASVELRISSRNEKGGVAVIMLVSAVAHNMPMQYSITNQADGAIMEALKDKQHKCRKYRERVWLLLINTHALLDKSDFDRLDKNLFTSFCFEKVIVVGLDGTVFPIFERKAGFFRWIMSLFGKCYSLFAEAIAQKKVKIEQRQ